jgi:hypothetical protein
LATSLRIDGFDLVQVFREGNVGIYRKTKPGYEGFETIIIRTHEAYEIAGKTVEPAEMYPRSEAWGTLGWTYNSLEAAKKRTAKALRRVS